jgi:hypothetical protein
VRTEITVALALVATFAAAGCSSKSAQEPAASCTLQVRVDASEYKDAGDVRFFSEPETDEGIPIVLPWEANFFALALGRDRELPRAGVVARVSKVQTLNYPLAWGLPASVWYRNRYRMAPGQYELPPGRYQIVVRYSPNKHTVCYAATEPFVLTESTFWLSTAHNAQ